MEQQNQQPMQEKTDNKPRIHVNWKFIATFLFLGIVAGGIVGYYFLTQKPEEKKVEKVVYTKAAWHGDVGRVRSLMVANRDGTGRKILLEKMSNEYLGISLFVLLIPERNEAVIITQGRVYPYDINVEKIDTETGQRTKLAVYKEGGIHGMGLLNAILSPDKKKIAFTIRKQLLIVDITKGKLVELKPFYTDTERREGAWMAPVFWDSLGNIYLKSFKENPEENQVNSFTKVSPHGKREELTPEQKAFFNFASSESGTADFRLYSSPDGKFAAWIMSSSEENKPSRKILVYTVGKRLWFIQLKKDSMQTLGNEEAINFQKERLDSPLHNVEIKGGSKEDVGGAQLYIDGVLIDSIRRISVGFGHGEAFEALGFVKGLSIKDVEKDAEEERWEKIQQLRQSLLHPTYLPDGWKEDEKLGDEIGVNTDFQGMTLYFVKGEKGIFSINQRRATDITDDDEGKPHIPEFILEDVSSGRQPIDFQESVAIGGREGIYIVTYSKTTQYVVWNAEGFDVYIACETFNDCRFSKSELLAIASSMIFSVNRSQKNDFVSTSDWQTHRNDEFGFEFRYPNDWGVEEYAPGALRLTGILPLTSERLPYIGISSYDRTRSGISYCEAYPEHQGRCEKFINGNVSGMIEWFEDYPTHATALVDLSDQVTLVVSMGGIGKFAKIPDEIKGFFRTFLSAFRFVDKGDDNTTQADNKFCLDNNDCSLLVCGGCFSKEFLKDAPPDLACIQYQGYTCECIKNACAEVKIE